MPFSDPTDRYQLFKMERADFARWFELPEGYEFTTDIDRDGERKLLQSEFPYWEIPYNRELPGLLEDAIVCVVHEGKVVSLLYGAESETGEPDYGQIHYAAVDPDHRGQNLLAAMVTELFRRFPEYKGGYFKVDREGHQPMYERWGGDLKGEEPKPPEPPPPSPLTKVRGKLGALRRRIFSRG